MLNSDSRLLAQDLTSLYFECKCVSSHNEGKNKGTLCESNLPIIILLHAASDNSCMRWRPGYREKVKVCNTSSY